MTDEYDMVNEETKLLVKLAVKEAVDLSEERFTKAITTSIELHGAHCPVAANLAALQKAHDGRQEYLRGAGQERAKMRKRDIAILGGVATVLATIGQAIGKKLGLL